MSSKKVQNNNQTDKSSDNITVSSNNYGRFDCAGKIQCASIFLI